MRDHILASLEEARQALESLIANDAMLASIEAAASLLVQTFESGRQVFSCGNGGSMSDAIHFAEELSGRYRSNRRGLAAQAISDIGHISCVGNDYGYDFIFSRYLESHAKPGDVLLGISTSGRSRNVITAAEVAKKLGVRIVTLTGVRDSVLGSLADIDICTPGGAYADRVQELHIKVIHILIEMVERTIFPENYPAADAAVRA
jgi:D-sedoheptulose 7-phosphate isomerase